MEITGGDPIGKDVFLRLLTTQLEHQDPLSPMESTDFVSQLAEFTQLENMTEINETLGTLVKVNSGLNNYGAAGLIGKNVQVKGNILSLSNENDPAVDYRLEGDAQEVTIQIFDANDRLVNILKPGAKTEGLNTLSWDGLDLMGAALPQGRYRFEISALDVEKKSINATGLISGIVSGVNFESGIPHLVVNGEQVPASEVMAVHH